MSCSTVSRPHRPPGSHVSECFSNGEAQETLVGKVRGRETLRTKTEARRVRAGNHAVNTVSAFDANRDLAGKIMDKGFCPR